MTDLPVTKSQNVIIEQCHFAAEMIEKANDSKITILVIFPMNFIDLYHTNYDHSKNICLLHIQQTFFNKPTRQMGLVWIYLSYYLFQSSSS